MTRKDQISDEQAWYERWFGREYLELYAHRNQAEAKNDIDAIEKLLNLKDHQPVLDLACGSGRHSIELAARGYSVTGIDLSSELLEQARTDAQKAGLEIPFTRCDMREHPYHGEFGTVLNMFTSFGYFEDDAENQRIMAAIARALRPGGVFLIDYINRDHVLSALVPEDSKQINGKQVVQQRRFNQKTQRLEKTIIIENDAGQRRFTESVRLYRKDEMLQMAVSAGLAVSGTHGSLNGEAHQASSPRLILTGGKPDNIKGNHAT